MVLFSLVLACADAVESTTTATAPRQGNWSICWEDDVDPDGSKWCNDSVETFVVLDDRAIDFGGPCVFDWPAVSCWVSWNTQDYSEYQDTDYAYPDKTRALLGYFRDTETFKGRQVEATTWTPLDERWEGGSLTRSTVTATWVSED